MQAPTVHTAAATAGSALISVAGCLVRDSLLPPLFEAMKIKCSWQTTLGALQLLQGYAILHPEDVALRLSEVIASTSDCLNSSLAEVIPFIGVPAFLYLISALSCGNVHRQFGFPGVGMGLEFVAASLVIVQADTPL